MPDIAAQVVMALDFGRRRIGIACGDSVTRAASPITTLEVGPAGIDWARIASLLREWQPNQVVIGLPYNIDDSVSPMTAVVREFAAEFTRRHALPVALVDERYSSIEAHDRLKAQRQSGQRKQRIGKQDVDAAAACVILERWFMERA